MVQEDAPPPWRGWHVIGRFLPMLVLGGLFVLLGSSALAPTHDGESFGLVFVWVGVVLIAGAVLGMIFTKCPHCYRTRWVVCLHERDVLHTPGEEDGYYRELSPMENELWPPA